MTKFYIFITCVFFLPLNGKSQHVDERIAIENTIKRLFNGMALGDTVMMRSVFTPQAILVSVFRDKQGNPVLKSDDTVNDFLNAIAAPHPEPYHEETWNMNIQVDGDLAQVWCSYALYVGDTFSHCGVDAFHLFKSEGGWKIFHLADTRRKTKCDVPQYIRNKHLGN